MINGKRTFHDRNGFDLSLSLSIHPSTPPPPQLPKLSRLPVQSLQQQHQNLQIQSLQQQHQNLQIQSLQQQQQQKHLIQQLPSPPFPPQSTTPHEEPVLVHESAPAQRNPRTRRSSRQKIDSKSNTPITPPYEWATTKPCHVHSLEYLHSKRLLIISGDVQCKKCSARQTMKFDLPIKFNEVSSYIIRRKREMHDRAPHCWMNPETPGGLCGCGTNFVKPVMPENKHEINWLFLLLGQMLGFCTLEQLKYFCMCTGNHRTGAKDRVLYLTYLDLCKQLDPTGPFDR